MSFIIAAGAELNNTVSWLDKNTNQIITSLSFGDTSVYENFLKFKRYFNEKIKNKPDVILCDLHPMYNTSSYALETSKKNSIPLVKVQHHLAHIYSVAFEYGLKNFIGITADGVGYGKDRTIWGGEIFLNNKRVGSLEEHQQLGGDAATLHPPKMLLSILSKFLNENELKQILINKLNCFTEKDFNLLYQQLQNRFNCPITTSTGRVLDAASALLGICNERKFEGEPAIKLEQASTSKGFDLEPVIEKKQKDGRFILKTTPIFKFLLENIDKDRSRLAATVQYYLAQGFFEIANKISEQNQNLPIVFSGGCACNKIMSGFLREKGVLLNKNVPCGDAGISYGQMGYYLRENNKNIEGKRKIIKVGTSIAALLPKKVEEYGIHEGLVDEIKVLSSDSLVIKFSKDVF